MPYFVYILLSHKDHKLYVGCATDVEKRMMRHNNGNVPAIKYRRPLVLICKEPFENKADAFKREQFLKSLWSGREKKKILKEYLNKIGRNNL